MGKIILVNWLVIKMTLNFTGNKGENNVINNCLKNIILPLWLKTGKGNSKSKSTIAHIMIGK